MTFLVDMKHSPDYDSVKESVEVFSMYYAGPYTLQLEQRARDLSGRQDDFCIICLQKKPERLLYPRTGPGEVHYCPRRFCSSCYSVEPHWRMDSSRSILPETQKYSDLTAQSCSLCLRRGWDRISPLLGSSSVGWNQRPADYKAKIQLYRQRRWLQSLEVLHPWKRKLLNFPDNMTLKSDRELLREIDKVVPVKYIKNHEFAPLPINGKACGTLSDANLFDPDRGFDFLCQQYDIAYAQTFTKEPVINTKISKLSSMDKALRETTEEYPQTWMAGDRQSTDPDTVFKRPEKLSRPMMESSISKSQRHPYDQSDVDSGSQAEVIPPGLAPSTSSLRIIQLDIETAMNAVSIAEAPDTDRIMSSIQSANNEPGSPVATTAHAQQSRKGASKSKEPLVEISHLNLLDRSNFASNNDVTSTQSVENQPIHVDLSRLDTDLPASDFVPTLGQTVDCIVVSHRVQNLGASDGGNLQASQPDEARKIVSAPVLCNGKTMSSTDLGAEGCSTTPSVPNCDQKIWRNAPNATLRQILDNRTAKRQTEYDNIKKERMLIEAKLKFQIQETTKLQLERLDCNAMFKILHETRGKLSNQKAKLQKDFDGKWSHARQLQIDIVETLRECNVQIEQIGDLKARIASLSEIYKSKDQELQSVKKSLQKSADSFLLDITTLKDNKTALQKSLTHAKQECNNLKEGWELLKQSSTTVEQNYEVTIIELEKEFQSHLRTEETIHAQLQEAQLRITSLETKRDALERGYKELALFTTSDDKELQVQQTDRMITPLTTIQGLEAQLADVKLEFAAFRECSASMFIELISAKNRRSNGTCDAVHVSGEHLSDSQLEFLTHYEEFKSQVRKLHINGHDETVTGTKRSGNNMDGENGPDPVAGAKKARYV